MGHVHPFSIVKLQEGNHRFSMFTPLKPDFQGPQKRCFVAAMGPMKTLQQSWLSSDAWGHP